MSTVRIKPAEREYDQTNQCQPNGAATVPNNVIPQEILVINFVGGVRGHYELNQADNYRSKDGDIYEHGVGQTPKRHRPINARAIKHAHDTCLILKLL
jgi:hypothetical protein